MNMQLEGDLVFYSRRIPPQLEYDSEFLSIRFCVIRIKSGFKWDGATLVRDGRRIDGRPITWEATCVHDCLYRERQKLKLSRKIKDKIFYDKLKECNFRHAYLYYIGVRGFGWISHM